jgi:hypothetical protein
MGMTHEDMIEEAARREAANKTLDEMTREERVDAALEELGYVVMGGQDGREYASSIAFIMQVLDSLR